MTEKELKLQYKTERRQTKHDYRLTQKQQKTDYISKRDAFRAEVEQSADFQKSNPPKRSVLEEIGNAVTHGAGAVFAIVAFILMLSASSTPAQTWSACIYFFGLFVLFSMSCLYHAFRHGSGVKRLFRRFDYSSIYLLIGATFAPILLCKIGGTFGLIFFILQWLIIATGITFIGVFGPSKLKPLHMTLYILLGWSGLLLLPHLITTDFLFFLYILIGGVVYSVGIIPFALKKGCAHFIWHFFVLAGAVVQWIGIYLYIYIA